MNEAYLYYVDYLKSINFEKKLIELKDKYQDKRVLLFGKGLFLDAILDNYDLKSYLNIIGISDTSFKETGEYKGFVTHAPLAIRTLGLGVILNTGLSLRKTRKFFNENHIVRNDVSIKDIIQYSFFQRIERLKNKIDLKIALKNNYAEKIRKLRSEDKLRVMFVCEDTTAINLVDIYNKMKKDSYFKLLPISVMPKRLFNFEPINQNIIDRTVAYFKNFSIDAIEGFDEESQTTPCVVAFKPDLIIYQTPKYIKDSFNPEFLSKNTLSVAIVDKSDKNISPYVKKQLSNMWCVLDSNLSTKEVIKKIKEQLQPRS